MGNLDWGEVTAKTRTPKKQNSGTDSKIVFFAYYVKIYFFPQLGRLDDASSKIVSMYFGANIGPLHPVLISKHAFRRNRVSVSSLLFWIFRLLCCLRTSQNHNLYNKKFAFRVIQGGSIWGKSKSGCWS